jgi:hypothetical protein
MTLRPITYKAACQLIEQLHRHHKPPQGWKYGIACYDGDRLCGVATVGRPVARNMDDGLTAEVTRLCTDGTPNVCSFLYSACWRSAKAMGYRRMITYILDNENGASLRASGWNKLHLVPGRKWVHSGNERANEHPLCDKWCYGVGMSG